MPEINKRYDRRVVDRYIEKGQIKDKDFQDHLKSLPDEEANATYVQMDLHDAEISEEDKGDDDTDESSTDEGE